MKNPTSARDEVIRRWPGAWIEEMYETDTMLHWYNVYSESGSSAQEADIFGRIKLASGSNKELAWQRAVEQITDET